MAHANPTAPQSATELQAQLEAAREGVAYIIWRRPDREQQILKLSAERLTIGRGEDVDIDLEGDEQVSRAHAELQRVGGAWVVVDDGISTNGTFVNGERVGARQRLHNDDLIGVGESGILFRDPASELPSPGPQAPERTRASAPTAAARELTATQRQVLIALCRPFSGGEGFAAPATNKQIAEELFLSVDAVKGHLRVLFEKFELGELPQNQKRLRLAELALQSGAVRPSDL